MNLKVGFNILFWIVVVQGTAIAQSLSLSQGLHKESYAKQDLFEIDGLVFDLNSQSLTSIKDSFSFGKEDGFSRFLSEDPAAGSLIFNKSPYSYAGNSPIRFIDFNGYFQLDPKLTKTNPQLNNILMAIGQRAAKDPNFVATFMKHTGLTNAEAMTVLSYGTGPTVKTERMGSSYGITYHNDVKGLSSGQLFVNKKLANRLEKIANQIAILESEEGDNHEKIRKLELKMASKATLLYVTTIHEGTHYGDIYANWSEDTDASTDPAATEQGILSPNKERGVDIEDDLFGSQKGVWDDNVDQVFPKIKTDPRGAAEDVGVSPTIAPAKESKSIVETEN